MDHAHIGVCDIPILKLESYLGNSDSGLIRSINTVNFLSI